MRPGYRMSGLHQSGTTMILVMIMLALAGCASKSHGDIRHPLLGKSKAEIVRCAGTPLRDEHEQGLNILTYYKEASVLDEAFPHAKSSFAKVHHGCWARLGMDNDHVVGIEYLPRPASYEDIQPCEDIFEHCQVADQPAN
jgi:hypothetical protein